MTLTEATELIKEKINAIFLTRGRVFVAIDGPCASGKSTLGARLASELGAPLIAADDFFLRPEQRTPERLATVGGNLDRERLADEVLLPLSGGRAANLRPYDCKTQKISSARVIPATEILIVEGSYSHHPELKKFYDLTVFLDTPPTVQWERIKRRESPDSAQRFKNQWIPLENEYFSKMNIRSYADVIITLE